MTNRQAAQIDIGFDTTLHPLLRRQQDHGRIFYLLDRRASVKDIVEALGVPHTEVGEIHINGASVAFSAHPENSDRIDISAVMPPLDVTRPTRLRPEPLLAVRFLVDENVGKLAPLLRALGYDTTAPRGIADSRVAAMAHAQGRIMLTRDVALLKRKHVVFGRWVRATDPDLQLQEVARHFGLTGPHVVFQRCLHCNTLLTAVAKTDIDHRLEPNTRRYFNTFKWCTACDRLYWHGSHCDRMMDRFRSLGLQIESEMKPNA